MVTNQDEIIDTKLVKDHKREKDRKIKQILSLLQAEEQFKINSVLNMNLGTRYE